MIALAVPSARETVGRWSDEVFLSDAEAEPTPSTAGPSVGGELDAALSAAGIPESVVPRWFPNDCAPETVACEVWETGGEVTAALSNGGGSMIITSGEQSNMQAALCNIRQAASATGLIPMQIERWCAGIPASAFAGLN